MPFRPQRLRDLRESKALSQEQLSKLAGLSQSVIAKSENGKNLPGSEALDKLARALDCTIDYLHGRDYEDESPGFAAAHMAFDVLVAQQVLTDYQREGCRRALKHRDAPKTAQAWRSFAEMLDLALGAAPSNTPLALVGGGPRPKSRSGLSRRHRN